MWAKIFYVLGIFQLGRRKWENAAIAFEKALTIHTNPPSIWYYRLGFSLGKLKRWDDAEPYLRLAAEAGPANIRRQIRLGMALEQTGKKAEAAEIYQRLISENAADGDMCAKAGKVLFALGRWGAAEDAFAAAIGKGYVSDDVYFQLANALHKQGKIWQEIEALKEAVALSDDIKIRTRLGGALYKMGRYKEAAKTFEVIVQKGGSLADRYRCGLSYELAGVRDQSAPYYASAIAHDTKHGSQKFGIGALHQHFANWDLAAKAYEDLLAKKADDGEIRFRAAYAFERLLDWEKAAEHYLAAASLVPDRPHWHYRLGLAYERCNRLEDAALSYAYATKISPVHKAYWYYRLGFVRHQMRYFSGAVDAFLKVNYNGETRFKELTTLASSARPTIEDHYAEHFYQNTVKVLERAAANDPSEADWHIKLSAKMIEKGNLLTAADELLCAAARSEKHLGDLYYQAGSLYAACGDIERASETFLEMRQIKYPLGIDSTPYMKNVERRTIHLYMDHRQYSSILPRTIVYESFGGVSASCNPLALFKKLIDQQEYKEWTHVWVLDSAMKLPVELRTKPNVVVIKKGSDAYIKYLATASHLINNSTFPAYFVRRSEQKYLNTWHGTPMKTLGLGMKGRFMEHRNGVRNFLQASHLLSPDAHTTRIMLQDFGIEGIYRGKMSQICYPRVDMTLNVSSERLATIRRQLGIIEGIKVVFYAPTWRGTHQHAHIDDHRLLEDITRLKELGYHVLFRGHSMVQDRLVRLTSDIKFVPEEFDTNEVLAVSDVLITDYSSVYFDFMHTGKPSLLYCYDLDEYEKDRGLYFNPSDLPAHFVTNIDEVCSRLREIFDGQADEPINRTGIIFTEEGAGSATESTIRFFFNDEDINLVDTTAGNGNLKQLLVFAGPFMPNGITSSLLNLLNTIDSSRYKINLIIDPNGIDGFPERMRLFSQLPSNVNVIPRGGLMNMNIEDRWVIETVHQQDRFCSYAFAESYMNAHAIEYQRVLGEFEPDAIINFEGYHKFWASLLANGKAKRKVIYMHNEMHAEWTEKFPYLRIVFESYNRYDAIAGVSEILTEKNRSDLGSFVKSGAKFVAIPNLIGYDAILRKANDTLDADLASFLSGEKLFLTIGRMSPEKDQKKLLDAFALLLVKWPNAQLILVGDGPLRHSLKQHTKLLNIESRVMFAGIRPNPFPLLRIADCFVLSSNHEGQPMTLLEALALGKPIVATNIVGNRGVLCGYDDYLVDNSIEGLVAGMERICEGDVYVKPFSAIEYERHSINRFYDAIGNLH